MATPVLPTKEELEILRNQGFQEGDIIPGRGLLTPGGFIPSEEKTREEIAKGKIEEPIVIAGEEGRDVARKDQEFLREQITGVESQITELEKQKEAAMAREKTERDKREQEILALAEEEEEEDPEITRIKNEVATLEADLDTAISSLDNIRVSAADASSALIDSIRGSFDIRRQEMRDINERTLAQFRTFGIRQGTERFSPLTSIGILSFEERAGLARIVKLDTNEASLVADAQLAATQQDFALLHEKIGLIESRRAEKVKALKDLQKELAIKNEDIKLQNQKANREMATMNFINQGIIEPGELFNLLGGAIPVSEITSLLEDLETTQIRQREQADARIERLLPFVANLLTEDVDANLGIIQSFAQQNNIPVEPLLAELRQFEKSELRETLARQKDFLAVAKLEKDLEKAEDPLDRQLKLLKIADLQVNIAKKQQALEGTGNEIMIGGAIFTPKSDLMADGKKKVQTLESGLKLVDQVERLYYDALGGDFEVGPEARLSGIGRGITSFFGFNPKWTAYKNFLDSNRAPIAKGLKGEVGNLTEEEQKQALKSFPGATSSGQEATAAFENIRKQITDNFSTLGAFRGMPIFERLDFDDDINQFISE